MQKGDKVIAKRPLGLMRAVPKGTTGVVRNVGFFGRLTVDFGSGRVLTELTGDDVRRAPAFGPW